MMGLVIWILCGISLNKLKQKKAEDQFEAQLQNELNASNPTHDYSPDIFQ